MGKVIDYFSSKIIVLILIISLYHGNLFSQNESKYFIDVNFAKTTITKSLFNDNTYFNLSYANGIRVGKVFNNNSELFLSIQNETNVSDLTLIGSYSTFRHQIGFGGNLELLDSRSLKLNLGGELLINFNKHSGYYTSDAPFFFYPLNNLVTIEIGAATILQLNYSLSSKLSIILNSRIGIYHRAKSTIDDLTIGRSTYQIFEPVNMLALRINI